MQTRGLRNNNPFNIRKSSNNWIGKIKGTDKEFETFDTLEHGYRAGLIILRTYYNKYKLHTYGDIIHRFAPPCENELTYYYDYIFQNAHLLPTHYLKLNTLLYVIAPHIACYESGLRVTPEFADPIVKSLIK